MSDLIQRAYEADFDVRTSRRLIEGLAVPFNTKQLVSDDGGRTTYTEEWSPEAFNDQLRHQSNIGRVRFTYNHDPSLRAWIGRTKELRVTSEGLVGVWRADETDDGDVALYKASSGQLSGLSIGARPEEDVTRGNVVTRVRAKLMHVSLVEDPAYDDARVEAVRNNQVDLSAWTDRLAEMRKHLDGYKGP